MWIVFQHDGGNGDLFAAETSDLTSAQLTLQALRAPGYDLDTLFVGTESPYGPEWSQVMGPEEGLFAEAPASTQGTHPDNPQTSLADKDRVNEVMMEALRAHLKQIAAETASA